MCRVIPNPKARLLDRVHVMQRPGLGGAESIGRLRRSGKQRRLPLRQPRWLPPRAIAGLEDAAYQGAFSPAWKTHSLETSSEAKTGFAPVTSHSRKFEPNKFSAVPTLSLRQNRITRNATRIRHESEPQSRQVA